MKLSWDIINEYVTAGKLIVNKHPSKDLFILNYSRLVQFEKAWDELLLSTRGLIVDSDCNIISKGLPKFFNEFEHQIGEIPYHLPYEVFVKMDGSLGIIFKYEGEVIIATRGSFASVQAVKAMEVFNKIGNIDAFIKLGITYNVEIHYKENRIVVDYGDDEKLVLLAAYDTKTGYEYPYQRLISMVSAIPESPYFELVKRFNYNGKIEDLKNTIEGADEGYVVRFENGHRIKIKGDIYCKIHRIVTNLTSRGLWACLRANKPLEEILEHIPDEWDRWARSAMDGLKNEFKSIEDKHRSVVKKFDYLMTAKEFSLVIIPYCKERNLNFGIVFSMYHGYSTEWHDTIWKMIKPKYEKASEEMAEYDKK